MTEHIVGLVALLSAVVQIIAMGVIGYPLARRRPGGMDRFRSSGFLWWIGTLSVITLVGAVGLTGSMAIHFPSQHESSLLRVVSAGLVAFVVILLVELLGERILFGPRDAKARRRATEKYEGALPSWARQGKNQLMILALVALLEEFVFRALALGSLWHVWDFQKSVSAGLVAVAFGFSHWYYGFRQIVLKLVVGSVLVSAALSGGWLAAAAAHVALNVVLVVISWRRSACRNP